ncbi:unnamed protein product [Boreogadus saida]
MIRKPNKPLEQVIRRLSERSFKSSEVDHRYCSAIRTTALPLQPCRVDHRYCSASSTTALPLQPCRVNKSDLHSSVNFAHISASTTPARLVLQHLRTIEEELKEVKQQVAVNTAMIQRLGGGGVADLGLVEDTNMPLSNAEDLDELERRLISDVT